MNELDARDAVRSAHPSNGRPPLLPPKAWDASVRQTGAVPGSLQTERLLGDELALSRVLRPRLEGSLGMCGVQKRGRGALFADDNRSRGVHPKLLRRRARERDHHVRPSRQDSRRQGSRQTDPRVCVLESRVDTRWVHKVGALGMATIGGQNAIAPSPAVETTLLGFRKLTFLQPLPHSQPMEQK